MKSKLLKRTAILLAFLILTETLMPAVAMALTSGPAQPEFQSFQPAGVTDMVDLFSGNFNYNIPLLDVGGYPLNISYSSDNRMDDEASWVGLGWTLSPGAINRTMRGLPDDFNGEDNQLKRFHIKKDITAGISVSPGLEVFGKDIGRHLQLTGSLQYNTRRGFEFSPGVKLMPFGESAGKKTAELGLSFAPSTGLNINGSIGLQNEISKKTILNQKVSSGFNSRQGIKVVHLNQSLQKGKVLITNPASEFDFGPFSYTPTVGLPLVNKSLDIKFGSGGEAFGAYPKLQFSGYWSEQSLSKQFSSTPAFGYLHLDKVDKQNNTTAVMDYNSDLNGQHKIGSPNIPLAYGTYDLFSITGQGVSGSFHAKRNDMGVLRPGSESNLGVGGTLGFEFGPGGLVHAGADLTGTVSDNYSGEWDLYDNQLKKRTPFISSAGLKEGSYFKNTSEITPFQSELYNATGGDDPIRVTAKRRGFNVYAAPFYKDKDGNAVNLNYKEKYSNNERAPRNQVISYLTNQEVRSIGLNKKTYSYPKGVIHYNTTGDCIIDNSHEVIRNDIAQDHHIGQFDVTQADGSRYIYGLPVYNTEHREISFSTLQKDPEKDGEITYLRSENGVFNKVGRDQLYDETITPAYSTSHLLTGLLSPDYMDRTGDGITDDDLGNAIKFNYSKMNGEYKWRSSIDERSAKINQAHLSDEMDDKASFHYGEKEIWYPHSIESRNMIAIFHTSPRADGLGVIDVNGGKDANATLEQLDRIDLYSKSELTGNASPIPIKSVHFVYAEENLLCQGSPNSDAPGQGKLTLEKIYFTYQNSDRGKLNAYQFGYKNDKGYELNKFDRWGNYKDNEEAGYPANDTYPYVLQDDNADMTQQWAGMWNLNQITLPSRAVINIDYQSDDYAYVQDKRAAQMLPIIGFSDSKEGNVTTNIYQSPKEVNEYMVVKIPENYGNDVNEVVDRYIGAEQKLYFNVLLKLKNNNHERVSGYLEINHSNPIGIKDGLLYIPVKTLTDKKAKAVHPITYAGLQMMRLELPHLVYPGYENREPSLGLAFFKSLFGLFSEIENLFSGFERSSMSKNWAKTIQGTDKNESWVRLMDHDYKKLGGGSRVSKVTISSDLPGMEGATFGQRYDYTKTLDGQELSSGVASYEPALGGEENSLKSALPYEEKYLLAPKNTYYAERPIGEALYPSASVGYSRVTVTDIGNDNFKRNQSGKVIHQFYTSKDFPTKVDYTTVKPTRSLLAQLPSLLKLSNLEEMALTQGFTIEVNDMHGKPKRQTVLDKNDQELSSTKYEYNVDPDDGTQLSNKVQMLDNEMVIHEDQMLGMDIDIWQEMTQESTVIVSAGAAGNFEGFIAAILPVGFPTSWPISISENTKFKTATTTKLVKRQGLLDKVVVSENGSTIETKNLTYDNVTGNVLLTETENEFGDNMFNFTYPAHWAYEDGMGPAFKNVGGVFEEIKTNADGVLPFAFRKNLVPGDELLVEHTDEASGATLKSRFIIDDEPNVNVLVNDDGAIFKNEDVIKVKIVRSGRRNLSSTPIGQVSSHKDPRKGTSISFDESQDVLDASAITFNDEWRIDCELGTFANPDCVDRGGQDDVFEEKVRNRYITGRKGSWRPDASYIYYNNRSGEPILDNTVSNIQNRGHIDGFEVFGEPSAWVADPLSKWTLTNTVTLYDTKGNELENVNAINVHSSAEFGFQKTLPTAVASNAKYHEIFSDGFEDYPTIFENDCISDNTERRKLVLFDPDDDASGVSLQNEFAHTGNHALRIEATRKVEFEFQAFKNCSNCDYSLKDDVGKVPYALPLLPYTNDCSHCLPVFHADGNASYQFSMWVATETSIATGQAPQGIQMRTCAKHIVSRCVNETFFSPTGPVIEGWQKIEGTVIPSLRVEINATNHSFLDDIRIHPQLSNMNSYVYDSQSLRLMAQLDENNYATFYEYDDEGILVRIKRETEKGVATIQEGRTVLSPNNN